MKLKTKLKLFFYPFLTLISSVYSAIVQKTLSWIKPSLLLQHNLFIFGILLALYTKATYHSFKKETCSVDILAVITAFIIGICCLQIHPLLLILPTLTSLALGNIKDSLKITALAILSVVGFANYLAIFLTTFTPGVNFLTAFFMPLSAVLLTSAACSATAITAGYFLHKEKYKEATDQLISIPQPYAPPELAPDSFS